MESIELVIAALIVITLPRDTCVTDEDRQQPKQQSFTWNSRHALLDGSRHIKTAGMWLEQSLIQDH